MLTDKKLTTAVSSACRLARQQECAAFGLVWPSYQLETSVIAGGRTRIAVTYWPADGSEPFAQWREFSGRAN